MTCSGTTSSYSAARRANCLNGGLTVGQLADNVSILWGRHTIKTGIDMRVNLRNNYQPGAVSGLYQFARAMSGNPQDTTGNTGFGLATFLLGAVSLATSTHLSLEPTAGGITAPSCRTTTASRQR